MKSILTLPTAFVLFVLFSFTFSSCKECNKNRPPEGNAPSPSPVRPQDQSPVISSPNNGPDGEVVNNGPNGKVVNNGPNASVVDFGDTVDLGDVVDISKIEKERQAALEAERQAVQAANDAQSAKDRAIDYIPVGRTTWVCEDKLKEAQKELEEVVVGFAKTAKTQAEQAAKAARKINAMNAALATNIEPSVRVAVVAAVHQAEEASRNANEAAVRARKAVVDTVDAIMKKWRKVKNRFGGDTPIIGARASAEIVKVAVVKVEWLAGGPPLFDDKKEARIVLAMMWDEKENVTEYVSAHPSLPGKRQSFEEELNGEAQVAIEKAEAICK
jgi:glutathione S-transferase